MRKLPNPNSNWWLWVMHAKLTLMAAAIVSTVVLPATFSGQLGRLLSWTHVAFWIALAFLVVVFVAERFSDDPLPASQLGRTFRIFQAYAGVLALVTFAFVLAGAALVTLGSAKIVATTYAAVIGWMQSGGAPKGMLIALAVVATAAAGGAFFVFRLRQRLLYGCTEALVGIAVGGHRLSVEPGDGLPTETGFYFAVLTAGVYLVVRGLDNIHQAVKANDKLFLRLRAAVDAFMQPPGRRSTQSSHEKPRAAPGSDPSSAA